MQGTTKDTATIDDSVYRRDFGAYRALPNHAGAELIVHRETLRAVGLLSDAGPNEVPQWTYQSYDAIYSHMLTLGGHVTVSGVSRAEVLCQALGVSS